MQGTLVAPLPPPAMTAAGPLLAGAALPEAPVLFAGALGGPLVIGLWAPLRNACTLAAQDSRSTARQIILQRVFGRGLLQGWTGASAPAAAAAVQFTTLGPGYHFFRHHLGSSEAAVAAGALAESVITYAPSTRNAQLMHNRVADAPERVTVRGFLPAGPGFGALVARNCLANAGIRVLSQPVAEAITRVAPPGVRESGACKVGGDFFASVLCGVLSMPFNQLFNFQVTSRASLESTPADRARLGVEFLKRQYFVTSSSGALRPSRIMLRDASLRSMYIGCVFSTYAAVERAALSIAARA
ncbi:unnamed protein product [Prorocentrum cordatum]|uniref:Uncharacterized protein n=1 Tax=Prorocentrum cordatum TaxID=2364126 RepID=A0ABN9TKY2_9DINO|nr:unnamed protein product [Polarella glacialis]